MIDGLIRDFQLLRKADTLIARIWAEAMLRRTGLLACAGLIAAFGLAMANMAGFFGLQPAAGAVWAAAIVALVDFALAVGFMLVAKHFRPVREIELAFELRNVAVTSIEADARDLKAALEAFAQDIRGARDSIVGLVHNPLDMAAQKLLIPAALSIIRGVRSKKAEG